MQLSVERNEVRDNFSIKSCSTNDHATYLQCNSFANVNGRHFVGIVGRSKEEKAVINFLLGKAIVGDFVDKNHFFKSKTLLCKKIVNCFCKKGKSF